MVVFRRWIDKQRVYLPQFMQLGIIKEFRQAPVCIENKIVVYDHACCWRISIQINCAVFLVIKNIIFDYGVGGVVQFSHIWLCGK